MKRILLVEDDKKKISDIKEHLSDFLDGKYLEVKESYQSGLKEILIGKYDLLLLDMSIPTWDNSPSEIGNNFEKYGGYTILKELVRRDKSLPTILITMFDDFGESDSSITLTELDRILRDEFTDFYKGFVYYSSRETKWKEELSGLLKSVGVS